MPTIDIRTVITVLFAGAAVIACLAFSSGASASVAVAAAGDVSCPRDSTVKNKIMPGQVLHPAAQKCQGHRVAKVIKDEHPDVVLAVGDLIQGQKSYESAYGDFSRAWFSALGKRIYASVGNHDYHRNRSGRLTASGYYRYWKHKKAKVVKYGKPHLGWSSWNRGRWHMINLNSNCFATDCAFTSRQLFWLLKDLKADRRNRKTKCTLAYFHHPLFSAGVRRGRDPRGSLLVDIWELLYRFRTDIVINGHQHHYERFRPQNPSGKADGTGITEIISGTGGASTFAVEDEKGHLARNSVASYRGLGATFLKLGNGKYRSYFRDLDGEIHDATRVKKCHRPNSGKKRRAPRIRRYDAHIKRMARLRRSIATQRKRLGKLETSLFSSPRRLKVANKRLRKTIARRDRVREKTLY
ncbi:MAG: metallophosphoesterase [Thermoleophilia bacterium]|nr:metallophosphoesterase [Thermoleophilia bacterium]